MSNVILGAMWVLVIAVSFPHADAQQNVPRLGSSLESFVSRFGQPIVRVRGSVYDFEKCPGRTAQARWSVMFEDDKAISILRNTCGAEKHASNEAKQEAKRFFPPDAGAGKQFTTNDGEQAERHVSRTLGKMLEPRHFEDCDGKPVTPGTFLYLLSRERTYWTVVAGLCP
jgi:hypothetical protein